MNLIQSLTKAGKLAITAIHDLNLAARYCSRLILLDKNEQGEISIVADGSPAQVLNNHHLARCFNIKAELTYQDSTVQLRNIQPFRSHR